MLKYFIVQLDDSSVSFCNYNPYTVTNLIDIDNLINGLKWAVKQGLQIQVLYPYYKLPQAYTSVIAQYEHIDIKPENEKHSDVIILSDWNSLRSVNHRIQFPAVLRTSIEDFLKNHHHIVSNIRNFARLNISFTNIDSFSNFLVAQYETALRLIANKIVELYKNGIFCQFNLLSDRTMLTKMNNCNAGVESITLAPDGLFYICPAFYLDKSKSVGNPENGIKIPNPQLYRLDHAPICRECDAFHCKRCVWLNKRQTLEVNTPGREQCVMAHIERRISIKLLNDLRSIGYQDSEITIPQVDYIDPFDKILNK